MGSMKENLMIPIWEEDDELRWYLEELGRMPSGDHKNQLVETIANSVEPILRDSLLSRRKWRVRIRSFLLELNFYIRGTLARTGFRQLSASMIQRMQLLLQFDPGKAATLQRYSYTLGERWILREFDQQVRLWGWVGTFLAIYGILSMALGGGVVELVYVIATHGKHTLQTMLSSSHYLLEVIKFWLRYLLNIGMGVTDFGFVTYYVALAVMVIPAIRFPKVLRLLGREIDWNDRPAHRS